MLHFDTARLQRLRQMAWVCVAYLTLFGLALAFWLRSSGVQLSFLIALPCFAPAILGLWLSNTSTQDADQYIARMLACTAFTPVLLLFWGTSLDPDVPMAGRLVWPFAVAAGLAHALAFVGLIFWGGSFATRVPAQAGVAPCRAADLRARLLALNGLDAPLRMTVDEAGVLTAMLLMDADASRSHSVTLRLMDAKTQVRVRERVSASGARPRDAKEASMRGVGDAYTDPTRPEASKVSSVVRQTSMIDGKRLDAVPLRLFGQGLELPPDYLDALDADGAVILLCALVTRSGWTWQPEFFDSGDS